MEHAEHGIYLVLTGEKPSNPVRSLKTAQMYRANPLPILISGGCYGLAQNNGPSESDIMKEYLIKCDIPKQLIYTDSRSFETLGNFTFPVVDPIQSNPNPADFEQIFMITETEHMTRAYDLAVRVLPPKKITPITCIGDYQPQLGTHIYHREFLRALDTIKHPTPEKIHNFLLQNHPHHSPNWFEKSIPRRIAEYPIHVLRWRLLE
jgi:uncharacterized SAM-binding protein YcdF (DUF218 family)